jgi:hypothetical protein
VEKRLGRAVFVSAAQADVSVEGHVEPTRDGWHASLLVRDARGTLLGTRELAAEGQSCGALKSELVLVIALMIDPEAAMRPPPPLAPSEPARTPPPTPDRTPSPARDPVVVPEPERHPAAHAVSADRPWRTDAGVGAALNFGQLPKADLGVAAQGVIVPPGFWGVEVYGAIWFVPAKRGSTSGAAEFTLAYAGLALCPLLHRSAKSHYSACVGGELGDLHVRASGFDVSYTENGFVADLAVRGRLGFALGGPFEVRVGTSLALPLVREHVVYTAPDGDHELFRVLPVAVVADAGLGVRFP